MRVVWVHHFHNTPDLQHPVSKALVRCHPLKWWPRPGGYVYLAPPDSGVDTLEYFLSSLQKLDLLLLGVPGICRQVSCQQSGMVRV